MSKTWNITLGNYDNTEDIVTIENTINCEQTEGFYSITLDNDIKITFDKPIINVEVA